MTPKFLKFDNLENPTTGRMLEYVDKKACILTFVTNFKRDKALFVKQFRVGSKSEIYECVAGVIEEGQTPEDALYAELRQEVGVSKDDIFKVDYLGQFYSSVGWTNELAHIYVVQLKEEFVHKEQQLDEEEALTYKWIDIKDCTKLWGNGPIPIKTALALNHFTLTFQQKTHKQKICIFGGSFNPVTNLHMSMAERVIDELNIDKFIFEPVGDKYEKHDIIPSKDRYNMLTKAIEDAQNPKLEVGSYEISQFVQPTTMHTLTHYREIYPDAEIYFMVGSDNLKLISGWANNETLLKDFQLVCIQREGDDNIYQDIILNDIYLSKHHKQIHILYENATNNISSTKVRNLVKANKSITWLVPPKVKKYINENNLYNE